MTRINLARPKWHGFCVRRNWQAELTTPNDYYDKWVWLPTIWLDPKPAQERSLVEMELTDSDTGYAERRRRQAIADADWHRHYDKTRKHEKRGV